MTNNTQGIRTEVKVNGLRLETLTTFRYLGSIITDEGSKPEILARIAQTTAALTRLTPLWNDRNITVSSKIRLMHSLVMSIFLYASETWTLSADLQKRIQAMEMRCFRTILRISYKDHVTNEVVRNKIKQAIGPYEHKRFWSRSLHLAAIKSGHILYSKMSAAYRKKSDNIAKIQALKKCNRSLQCF